VFNVRDLVVCATDEFDDKRVRANVKPTTTTTPDFFPRSTTHNAQVAWWTWWSWLGSRFNEQRLAFLSTSVPVRHHGELPTRDSKERHV
jgi:hypothetical protein